MRLWLYSREKNMDNILLFLTPLLLCPPLIEAKNINCNNKSFHCVNSTHFLICVDLGGGVSTTIDSFVIQCPPTTFCHETNHFECEYQALTTQKTESDVTKVFADTNTLTDTTETISSKSYQVYISGVNNSVTKLVPNELDSDAFKVQSGFSDINEIQTTHVKISDDLATTDDIKLKNVSLGNLQNYSVSDLYSIEIKLEQTESIFPIAQYNMTNAQVNDSDASNLYSMKKNINNRTKEFLFNGTENISHLKLNSDPSAVGDVQSDMIIDLFTNLENIITTPRDNIAFENRTTANKLNLEHDIISDPIVTKMDLGEYIGNTILSNTSMFTTVKNGVVKLPVNDSDSNNARKNESAYETATDNKLVNNIQLRTLNFDVYAQSQNNTFRITQPSIDLNIKSEVTTTSDMLSDTIIAETFSSGMYVSNNSRINNTTTLSVPGGDFMTMKNQIRENTQVTNPYKIEMDLRVFNKSEFTTPMNMINTNVEKLVNINTKKILKPHHIKELLFEVTENVRYEDINYELNSIGESHVLSKTPENIFATQSNNTTIKLSDNEPISELSTISNPIISPIKTSFYETFKNDIVTKPENYSLSNGDRINVSIYETPYLPVGLKNNAFASTEQAINLSNLSEVTTTSDMLSDTVTVGIVFPRVQEIDNNGANNDPITFVTKEKSMKTETYKVKGGLNDVIKTMYNGNTSNHMIYTNNLKNKNILQENHKNVITSSKPDPSFLQTSKKSTLDNRRQDSFMNVRDNQETESDFLTNTFTIIDKKVPSMSITVKPFEITNLSKPLEVNNSALSSQVTLSLFVNKLSKMPDNDKNKRNITLLSVGEYNSTQLDESVTSVKKQDTENNILRRQQIFQTTYFSEVTTSLPNTEKSFFIKYTEVTPAVSIDALTGVNSQLKSKKLSTLSQYDDVLVDSNKTTNTLSNKTLKQYCFNDTISNMSLENKLTATEANYKSTKDGVGTTNKLLTTVYKRNNLYDEYNTTELVPKGKQQIKTIDKSHFAVKPFVYSYKTNLTSEGNFNNVSTKIQSKEHKISDDRNFSYSVNNNVSKSDKILNSDLVIFFKSRKTITSIKTSRTHKQLLPNTLENVKLGNSSKINKPILNFNCRNRSRGRYADEGNCRKFYICIGIVVPIPGLCPMDTVFSEFQKQCTRNLSHCVRKNLFQCVSEGRFDDVWEHNIYYICVKGTDHRFIRFKFQCQNGYRLDKISLTCKKVKEFIKLSYPTLSSSLYVEDNKKISKTITKKRTDKYFFVNNESFKCEKEGKFSDPSNCRRYYVCNKTSKSILRRKRKSCDSDEVFDKDKNKCVDQDSHEC